MFKNEVSLNVFFWFSVVDVCGGCLTYVVVAFCTTQGVERPCVHRAQPMYPGLNRVTEFLELRLA